MAARGPKSLKSAHTRWQREAPTTHTRWSLEAPTAKTRWSPGDEKNGAYGGVTEGFIQGPGSGFSAPPPLKYPAGITANPSVVSACFSDNQHYRQRVLVEIDGP